MRKQSDTAAAILNHRKLTESRLTRLLEQAAIDDPPGLVQYVIYEYHHTRFTLFLKQMIAMFKSSGKRIDKGLLLMVIQDAWNYFPHSSLQGKCPAEIFLSELT